MYLPRYKSVCFALGAALALAVGLLICLQQLAAAPLVQQFAAHPTFSTVRPPTNG